MPVTVKVNGTDNTLVHKGSTGIAKCTAPDVCKTPSPGGPVPVPYPVIVSMSSDLADGTTTVKADGGNMCAIKGSNFSRCTGDEPGTAGGVKSNVNMKEATWILYSFDVKMDGSNACRKSDKMMMNHENTVCMTGEDQLTKSLQELKDIMCKCDKDTNDTTEKDKETCASLGAKKHKCCDDAIKAKNDPNLKGEHGYNGKDGSPFTNGARERQPGESFFGHLNRIRGTLWPDAQIIKDGKPKLIDFKFACPKGVGTQKPGQDPLSTGTVIPDWTPGKKGKPGQEQKYKDLTKDLGGDPDTDEGKPEVLKNTDCT
jgi:hypothetical protein